ncbi:MAG: TlpA family protein disulfide reductase [Chloroflexi bacterium]|nr:TlpA family protein disulfide reductase [Chloroflexota bacterium]
MDRVEVVDGAADVNEIEEDRGRGSRARILVVAGLVVGIMAAAVVYVTAGGQAAGGKSGFAPLAELPPIGRVLPSEGFKTTAARLNEPAPDFTFVDPSGATRKLSDYQGQAVMINFWASWCPPCVQEMPDIESVYREEQAKGLVVLGINLDDDPNAARRFLQARGVSFPSVSDGDQVAIYLYRVSPIPQTFFIDREGILRDMQVGAMTKGMIKKKVEKIL